MTRQRKWAIRKRAEGLCKQCGRERGLDSTIQLCGTCRGKHNVIQYDALGSGKPAPRPRTKHVATPAVLDAATLERQRINEERAARRAARRTDTSKMDWTHPSQMRFQ